MKLKLTIIICLLTLLFANLGRAQNVKEFDSLVSVIEKMDDGPAKIEVYDALYGYVNIYPNLLKPHLNNAIKLASKLKDSNMEMIFNTGAGKTFYELGDADKGLEYYLTAARIAEKNEIYDYLIHIYSMIADMLIGINKHDKAKEYLLKERKLIQTHAPDADVILANHYSNTSRLYFAEKQIDSALNYSKKVADISYKYYTNSPKDARLHANDLRNLGSLYMAKDDYKKADSLYNACIAILNSLEDKEGNAKSLARILLAKGDLKVKSKQYNEAHKVYREALQYASKINFYDAEMMATLKLSEVQQEIGNYKDAITYLKKYHELKDTLLSSDKQVRLTELEADYQMEKKNAILAQQEAETERQKGLRNISFIIAAAVVFGLITLAYIYNRIRVTNNILFDQNNKILSQKEELEKLNTVKDKMFSVVSHDLRNPINTLRTYLNLLKTTDLSKEKTEKYTKQIEQSIIQTSDLMDNLLIWAKLQLQNVKPDQTTINLLDPVTNVIEEVKPQAALKHITIESQIDNYKVHSNASIIEIAIRNILTNAIKFSHEGQKICVSTIKENNGITLSIQDYGIGMNEEQLTQINNAVIQNKKGTKGEKGSGLGLFLIIQLLNEINVPLHIKSQQGSGSTFSLFFEEKAQ